MSSEVLLGLFVWFYKYAHIQNILLTCVFFKNGWDSILFPNWKVKVLVTQSCPTLCDPTDCSPTRLLCPWNSPDKISGMGWHFLLQGIFLTQGLNPSLPHFTNWATREAENGKPGKGATQISSSHLTIWLWELFILVDISTSFKVLYSSL